MHRSVSWHLLGKSFGDRTRGCSIPWTPTRSSRLHVFSNYCLSEARWDHASEIQSQYGLREFTDLSARFRLNRWLYALCWTGTDRPSALFDRAIAWLMTHKVLLPGVTVLERHIVRIRTRSQERVARKEWGENASDKPASLSRRLSILAASIRVAGRFPSFRVLPKAIGKRGAVGRSVRPDISKYWSRSSSSLWCTGISG